MAKGSPGNILHFNGIKLRVFGLGNLKLTLRSVQNVNEFEMVDHSMVTATNREPFVLANFKEQRAQLEITTDAIGETFTISKIIVFFKPVETGYPQ